MSGRTAKPDAPSDCPPGRVFSVEEAMPYMAPEWSDETECTGEEVLIFSHGCWTIGFARYDGDGCDPYWYNNEFGDLDGVTHWTHFPPDPTK